MATQSFGLCLRHMRLGRRHYREIVVGAQQRHMALDAVPQATSEIPMPVPINTDNGDIQKNMPGKSPQNMRISKLLRAKKRSRPKPEEELQTNFTKGSERLNNPNPTTWLLPIPMRPNRHAHIRGIPIFPNPPSTAKTCREPLKTVSESEIARLDPTGIRTRMFDKRSADAVHVRDIILVRQASGEPFAGVVMRIVRKGHDSSVLLRNTITGVGVEMEFKIYSPGVTGIEIVQRRPRKPKQNRIYYMRHSKHDIGSVENLVKNHLRQRSSLGTAVGFGKKGKGKASVAKK